MMLWRHQGKEAGARRRNWWELSLTYSEEIADETGSTKQIAYDGFSRRVSGRSGGLGAQMIETLSTITFWVAVANLGIAVGTGVGRIVQLEVRKRGYFNSVQPDLRIAEVEWRRA